MKKIYTLDNFSNNFFFVPVTLHRIWAKRVRLDSGLQQNGKFSVSDRSP